MKPLLRLGPFLRPYRIQVLLALLATRTATGVQLLVPAIIQQIIDVGLVQGQVGFLVRAALLLLAIGVLRAALLFFQRFLSEGSEHRICQQLISEYRERIETEVEDP